MTEEIAVKIEQLKASLERIRELIEWNTLEKAEIPLEDLPGRVFPSQEPSDLNIEIGRFFVVYEDLKQSIPNAPANVRIRLREFLRRIWKSYFALIRRYQ